MNNGNLIHRDVIFSGKVFRSSRWNFKRNLIEKFHYWIPHITIRYMNFCIKTLDERSILGYNQVRPFYRLLRIGNMSEGVLLLLITPIIWPSIIQSPISEAAVPKASTVFARSNAKHLDSSPTGSMDVWICSVLLLSCVVGSELVTGRFPTSRPYRLWIWLRNWKSSQVPKKDCKPLIIIIIIHFLFIYVQT
jgi:hypothetical protein